MTTRSRRRVHRRSVYGAVLEPGGILRPLRGCWTRRVDTRGDILSDLHVPGRMLAARRGDYLLLVHSDITVAESALVEVTSVLGDGGRLVVAPRAGTMPTSERVFVMPGRRAKR